jgi:hypothetical protein
MPLQKSYLKKLYAIAEGQDGYFTAKQALSAGYSNRMQTYHVQNGDWIKEARGIFRLDSFPPASRPELMVWYLWSSNRAGVPQGVYSHETALEIHALSSWNTKKLNLTVPPGFQRMVVPKLLVLHRRRLESSEVVTKYGVKVTRPLKTIVDLLRDGGVPRKYLEEAVAQALDQQIILPGQIAKANLNADERRELQSFLRRSAI